MSLLATPSPIDCNPLTVVPVTPEFTPKDSKVGSRGNDVILSKNTKTPFQDWLVYRLLDFTFYRHCVFIRERRHEIWISGGSKL